LVNRVILVGNLGRDAELRYTPGGTPTATLNLAVTEKWKDKAGKLQEKTEWVRVVLWGKTAEVLSEYLIKGKQIYVEGKMQTREWVGKDGQKRYTTEVKADRVQLLGGKGGAAGGGRRQAPASSGPAVADPFDQPGGFEDPAFEDTGGIGGGADLTDDDIPF
jgi:single-strand DNA-binding protein